MASWTYLTPMLHFHTSWKSGNLWFSDVFSEKRNETLAWNGWWYWMMLIWNFLDDQLCIEFFYSRYHFFEHWVKRQNRYWEMGLLWKIFTKNYSFVQTGRKFYSFNGHTGNNNKILIRLLCDFIHVFHLQLLQLENFLHFLDLLFS